MNCLQEMLMPPALASERCLSIEELSLKAMQTVHAALTLRGSGTQLETKLALPQNGALKLGI